MPSALIGHGRRLRETWQENSDPAGRTAGPARCDWETPTRAGEPRDLGPLSLWDMPALRGLKRLAQLSQGTSAVKVAVLDGPVDRSHPCLIGADLVELGLAGAEPGLATRHGTFIASLLFGQPGQRVVGITPRCRGLLLPIFQPDARGTLLPSTQRTLARSIRHAVSAGAQVINLSAGELSPEGRAVPELAEAVRECVHNDVLIVAAAGNDGCDCMHVPGALPSVLAVGATDAWGEPLEASNWGEAYQSQGLLAPGEMVLGAGSLGGVAVLTGTSVATAIVAGVAALVLSLFRKRGERVSPLAVRDLLIHTAKRSSSSSSTDPRRLLAGRLDILSILSSFAQGVLPMSAAADQVSLAGADLADSSRTANGDVPAIEPSTRDGGAWPGTFAPSPKPFPRAAAEAGSPPRPEGVSPSDCGCAECKAKAASGPQKVFVIGQLGYDFHSEARRDSIQQHMTAQGQAGAGAAGANQTPNPHDPEELLTYLDANPWDASSILWTLNTENVPLYALVAQGPFASECCQRLRQYLRDQLNGVERVSIAGVTMGTARLFTGQVVPVLVPELRGMYNWKTGALAESVLGAAPAANAPEAERANYQRRARGLRNFLERAYYELRNPGSAPHERAINYAATQVFEFGKVYAALGPPMELDRIEVERSPVSRQDSDCWDVKLLFFNPESQVQTVRKVYRVTVDVSDVVPVTIGRTREWFVR